MDNNNFVWYGTFTTMIESLDDPAQRLQLITIIMEYGTNNIEPDPEELKGFLKPLWIQLKYIIDEQKNNYEQKKANGSLGGAPKGNQNARKRTADNKESGLLNKAESIKAENVKNIEPAKDTELTEAETVNSENDVKTWCNAIGDLKPADKDIKAVEEFLIKNNLDVGYLDYVYSSLKIKYRAKDITLALINNCKDWTQYKNKYKKPVQKKTESGSSLFKIPARPTQCDCCKTKLIERGYRQYMCDICGAWWEFNGNIWEKCEKIRAYN